MMSDEGLLLPLPLRLREDAAKKVFRRRLTRQAVRELTALAKRIALEFSARYSLDLWAEVPVMDGTQGPYASLPGMVFAAVTCRNTALQPMRSQLHDDQNRDTLEALVVWYLDCMFFRFCLEQVQVALLFGMNPVSVSDDVADRVAVSAAQFLFGLSSELSPDDLMVAAPLAIRQRLMNGSPPSEWLGLW